MTSHAQSKTKIGFFAALGAFMLWGLLPLYWKALLSVPPMVILCHRIIWSLIFIAIILTANKRWGETFAPMRSPRNLGILFISSLMIGGNWLLYIWAVNTGHVLETSLGYYINPLVSILFGLVFFRERLRRMQWLAIACAAVGVANSIFSYGELPWISLTLAVSFACYGLLRKIAAVGSLPGLFLETLLLAPIALGYLIILHSQGNTVFLTGDITVDALVVGAGVATATPLIGFAFGARNLPLSTLGVLQYTAPSIAFLLGVFVFREPFGPSHLVSFAMIWLGLAVYTFDTIQTLREAKKSSGHAP